MFGHSSQINEFLLHVTCVCVCVCDTDVNVLRAYTCMLVYKCPFLSRKKPVGLVHFCTCELHHAITTTNSTKYVIQVVTFVFFSTAQHAQGLHGRKKIRQINRIFMVITPDKVFFFQKT